MSRCLRNLQNCKSIVSVEQYSFDSAKLTVGSSNKFRKLCREWLSQIEAYSFVYKVNGTRVAGYVVLPRSGKALPCLIHLRGGSRDVGALTQQTIFAHMVRYAVEGYVVISTQYPGGPGSDGKDGWGDALTLESIKKLRAILKSIPAADTARIGMKGHSRGGLMTYMTLREVKWIRAAVISGAPTDQRRAGKERKGWREHQISLWGRSRSETIRRSPLCWAEELPKNTPLLLMHGSADWRVDPRDSIAMSQKLYEHAIPHRFILFEGADHGISEYRQEFRTESLSWFERFLKKDEQVNLRPHGD